MRRAADDQLAQIDDSSQECAELSPGDCAYFEDEIEFQPADPDFHCVRHAKKQESRDADAAALASGAKTREQLREENGKVRIARIHWDRVKAPR